MTGGEATRRETGDSVTPEDVSARLRVLAGADAVASLRRIGSAPAQPLGVRIPVLRQLARELGRSHELAAGLWATGVHEARILASMIDEPKLVTRFQMDRWVAEFDSWDVCDQVCGNLFDRTSFVDSASRRWAARDGEFVRRAGFVLTAEAAVHRKDLPDRQFADFLPVCAATLDDDRNFVKKAVSWAYRQIGKRTPALRATVLEHLDAQTAQDSGSARWILSDVRRELIRQPLARHRDASLLGDGFE